jgi:hypothetical protein
LDIAKRIPPVNLIECKKYKVLAERLV